MSALCQKQTSACLLDHVVGAGEQRRRDRETEGLCRLAIDYKLVLGRCLHRKVGRLLALEDAIDIPRRSAELLIHFQTRRTSSPARDKVAAVVDRGHFVFRCKPNDKIAVNH